MRKKKQNPEKIRILLIVTESPYRARSISEKQRFSEVQYLSRALFLCLSLSKMKKFKYLPSARAKLG